MGTPLRVLIIADSQDDLLPLIDELKEAGYDPFPGRAETAAALEAALRGNSWDIIVSDYQLPAFNCLLALDQLRKRGSHVPFILFSEAIGDEAAVEVMRAGACDYVMKGRRQRLIPVIERELRQTVLRQEARQVESLLRDQQIAERLAGEMAIMAEIGRLVGSTLNIDEVYERFAAEARKLIPFDRLSVSLNNPLEGTQTVAYVSGLDIPARRPGDSFPLEGTVNEALMRTRAGLLIPTADIGEMNVRFPGLITVIQGKMQSVISVPLISRGEVIGALHFRSMIPDAYTEQDLRLAERIGAQVTGAIANARLYGDLKRTEESLRESEERFRTIANYTIDWETWMGPDGRLLWVNPPVETMTGYTVEECLSHPDYPLFMIHPEDRGRIAKHLEAASHGGSGSDVEFRYVRKDGALRWGAVSWRPVFGAQGRSSGHRSSVHDITERKQMNEEIGRRSRQLTALYETSLELTAELNLKALLHSLAERALGLIGGTGCNFYLYNPETDLLERAVSVGSPLVTSKTTRRRGEGLIGQVWQTGAPLLVNDYKSWPGRLRAYDDAPSRAVVGVPVRWGEEFLGVLNIIAALPRGYAQPDVEMLGMFATQAAIAIRNARLYNTVEQSAVTDELTGLFNRRGLLQLGEREYERALRFRRPLAALMIDIDHFKRINDAHGHASGDQVLRVLADCFRQNTRGIDVAGRYGGEEFVLLLPETLLPRAIQIAERLRQSIADLSIPVSAKDDASPVIAVRITVSIGVAVVKQDLPDLAALIDRADQALYRAKRSGRNCVAAWEEKGAGASGSAGHESGLVRTGGEDRGPAGSAGRSERWTLNEVPDETEARRLLEEALQDSEDRFAQFMRYLPGRACIKDADGRFLFLNEGYRRPFGVDPAVWVGKGSADMWPPEIAAAIRMRDEEALAGRIVMEEEERPGPAPGETTWWLSYRFPIYRKGKPPLLGAFSVDATDFRRTKVALERTTENLRRALGAIIQTLSMTTEIRDPYTAGHQRRVADLAGAIAGQTGCSEDLCDGIRMAGMIHDIGKISIPAEILTKPTKLTAVEFSLIRMHPQVAFDILQNIDFTWPIAEIIYQHHERMDGSGYPRGLKGDAILPEARILAVADVVEAMASHRPYRPGLGLDAALAEITVSRGHLYDETAVDACLKVFAAGYRMPAD